MGSFRLFAHRFPVLVDNRDARMIIITVRVGAI